MNYPDAEHRGILLIKIYFMHGVDAVIKEK